MSERVHRVFAPLAAHPASPLVTACGQRDGELRPEALQHYVTVGGRVTCPDCLAGRRAAPSGEEGPAAPRPRQLSLGIGDR